MLLLRELVLPEQARRWQFNQNEWIRCCQLLEDGYPFAVLIYLLELRIHMNFRTGVVGAERRISLKGLCELLERQKKKGSHWGEKKPDKDFVRRQLKALERYGLLERLPKERDLDPLLFRLPLADTGLIRPQEERHKEHHKERHDRNPKMPRLVRVSGGSAMQDSHEEHHKEHHTSVCLQEEQGKAFTFEQLRAVDVGMVRRVFTEVLPQLPEPLWQTEAMRILVARVWYARADGKHQTEEFWRWYFEQCRESDFLMGRVTTSQRRRPVKANFSFLLDLDRVQKVINGEYT